MEPTSSKPVSSESTEKISSTGSSNSISSTSTATIKSDSSTIILTSSSTGTTPTSSVTSSSSHITTTTTTTTTQAKISTTTSSVTSAKTSTITASTATSSLSITSPIVSTTSTNSAISTSTSTVKESPVSSSVTSSTTPPSTTTSSSVTISLGVGALSKGSTSISKGNHSPPVRIPTTQSQPHQTKDAIGTLNNKSPVDSSVELKNSNSKDKDNKKINPSVKPTSPPVSSSVGIEREGPLGMKRPSAPSTGESGGPSSTGDLDSESSSLSDPKKKKMRKETKDGRSESPGVTTSLGSTSGTSSGARGSGRSSVGSTSSSSKQSVKGLSSVSSASSTSSKVGNAGEKDNSKAGAQSTSGKTIIEATKNSSHTESTKDAVSSGGSKQSQTSAKSGQSSEISEKTDEADSGKTNSSESNNNGGPKVPPLKIVLQSHPSSISSVTSAPLLSVGRSTSKDSKDKEEEVSSHHGSSSGTPGFPYVVVSSSTTPDGSSTLKDKDTKLSGEQKPSPGPSIPGTTKPVSGVSSTPESASGQGTTTGENKTAVSPHSINTTTAPSNSVTSSSVSSSNNQSYGSSAVTNSNLDKSSKEPTSSSSPPIASSGTERDKKSKSEETLSNPTATSHTSKESGSGKKSSVSSSAVSLEDKGEKDTSNSKEKNEKEITTSSNSGLKEKPISRVTRHSQRIAETRGAAATPNSPSSISPKTSACPSPSTSQHGDDQKQDEKMDTSEPIDLHPKRRKIKTKEQPAASIAGPSTSTPAATSEKEIAITTESIQNNPTTSNANDPPPMMNCFEMYLNIRKQIARRRRNLFPVTPKPPKGFKDYLMNRGTYVLQGNGNARLAVQMLNPSPNLAQQMKEIYIDQEKERHKLRLQHLVEKEKLVLCVEQEILRVHGRAARALSNQTLPFSVCTILKDEEVYNLLTPEQEEKVDARSRYNGRLFLSWLQDVDDKWDKIKEQMLLRHHNEAESLHAVQKMDWEWKLKEVGLCEPKATPQVDEHHVPIVHVGVEWGL